MINQTAIRIAIAAALVGACGPTTQVAEADGSSTEATGSAAPLPERTDPAAPATAPPADAGQYTSLDRSRCRLIEQNAEEGGYFRHECAGVGGYKLETSESDLRNDIVVIGPDGRRSRLQLSTLVAAGAFNELGKTAEWRGGRDPRALIVRLNVANPAQPMRPDTSKLVVARLEAPSCVVAVVPPGPGQNATARDIADGPLPGCMKP